MKLNQLILSLFLLISTAGKAQLSDYYNLKDVKNYRFNKLALSSEAEATKFIKNASEYNFISGLKISGTMPLKLVLDQTKPFYEFNELNLLNYSGEFSDQLFDSCTEIESLHLRISETKLSQLSCLKSLKKLTTLYLYIDGKPESLVDMKLIPDVRELHIVGDFLPKQLDEILTILRANGKLNILGISIDRITDLPVAVSKLYVLGDLYLYDNLSVFSNGGIDDLTEEKIGIQYSIYNDLTAMVNIHYMSSGSELAAFETAHLEKIYTGVVTGGGMVNGGEIPEEELSGDDKFFKPYRKVFQPGFQQPIEFNEPGKFFNVKSEVFMIDPTRPAIITTSTGLRLIIAPNSFVNINNEQVNEAIYIKVSEVKSPIELLFAGVNLYAGNQQYYNNQYLFNVQATTAKTEVSLKPNYQMKAIVPVAKDSSAEYFYDYESRSWQDLTLYNSVFSSTAEPIDFFKLENQGIALNYLRFDTSSMQTRYTSAVNYFVNDAHNDNQYLFESGKFFTNPDRTWTKDFNKDRKLEGVKIKRGRALVKIQKVTPKKRNKEYQYFKVVDKTVQQIFTELKSMKNINFSFKTNPENKKELSENFIKNIKFEDVRIEYKTGQNVCKIRLKYAEGYKEIIANITDTEDEKLYKKQIKKFNKAYKKYLQLLAQRTASFNANNAVRFSEFTKYVEDKVKANERNKTSTEIRLNQLGSFSLFTMKSISFSTNLIVQYTDERGVPIDVKELFMIDSRYQTVLRLDKKNMAINPATCTMIIAIDYNGDLYFANKSDIVSMNLTNNALTSIKLKKVSVKLNSIEAFNNYTK
ncbi:MAG: hypothetical protein V4613_04285 [Bacteroidota bacterium]